MRISDWSSDVCSSDLLQGGRTDARPTPSCCRCWACYRRFERGCGGLHRWSGEIRAIGQNSRALRLSSDDPGLVMPCARTLDGPGGRGRAARLRLLADGACPPAPAAACADDGAGVARSEEHTSDLRSLM